MNWLVDLWMALLPATDDVLMQNRIGLVIGICLLLTLVFLVLILVWKITGDLQRETVWVSTVYITLFVIISWSAYSGYWIFASWFLTILMTFTVAADTYFFGVSSPGSPGYAIPILLSSFNLGLLAAVLLTAVITALIWFCALAELTDWYKPQLPKASSHRTFNAPVMTVTFFTIALISGLWSQSLVSTLP